MARVARAAPRKLSPSPVLVDERRHDPHGRPAQGGQGHGHGQDRQGHALQGPAHRGAELAAGRRPAPRSPAPGGWRCGSAGPGSRRAPGRTPTPSGRRRRHRRPPSRRRWRRRGWRRRSCGARRPSRPARATSATRRSRPGQRGRSRNPDARQATSRMPTKATTPPVPADDQQPALAGGDVEPGVGAPATTRNRAERRRPSRRCCRWGRPRWPGTGAWRRARRWRPSPPRTAPPGAGTAAAGTSPARAARRSASRVRRWASQRGGQDGHHDQRAQPGEGQAQHPAGDLLGPGLVAGVEQLDEGGHQHGGQGARRPAARTGRSTASWPPGRRCPGS